jgi:dsDNA-binding SOS-regulon protein
MVRNSGIINMFGASPYLYVGRQKIEEEMSYKDLEGEQYDEMLENADKSRDLMIQGTVSFLEKTGKEVSVENVKRFLPRFATKIVENYMFLY